MRLGEMLRALTIKTDAMQSELAGLRQDVRRLVFLLERNAVSAASDAGNDAADQTEPE